MIDAVSDAAGAGTVQGFDPRPLDAGSGMIFCQPWQAQVFAMTVALNGAGLFSWSEWAEIFAAHRKASAEGRRPDDENTYYDDWLNALEEIAAKRSLASSEVQHLYKHAWEHAAFRTPHGKSITLQDGDFEHTRTPGAA